METKQDVLNRLFVENNLTSEDVFKHKFYNIITRSGIDKIMASNNIKISYDLEYNSLDCKCIIESTIIFSTFYIEIYIHILSFC